MITSLSASFVSAAASDKDSDDKEPAVIETMAATVDAVEKTRFMLIATSWTLSADACYPSYGGLGRFPKECRSADAVTLLNRIKKEDLGIPDTQLDVPIEDREEFNSLIDYIASYYKKELLTYLRTTGLDPEKYQTLYG